MSGRLEAARAVTGCRFDIRTGPLLTDPLTSPRLLLGSLAVLVLAGLLFGLWPGLDVMTAGLFFNHEDHFVAQGALGNTVRRVLSYLPLVILVSLTALYVLKRTRRLGGWAPNGAGVLMMALSLSLGPGLLINLGLKDHSHRPRPYSLRIFGGSADFRPFYRFDGSCLRNCSFASGEGAAGFWTVAPALLAPPAVRPVAVAAALALGTATSLLRMAFGGHFLSDTVFAALLTWLVIVLCWSIVARIAPEQPGSLNKL